LEDKRVVRGRAAACQRYYEEVMNRAIKVEAEKQA
jgi:hypothetical protein